MQTLPHCLLAPRGHAQSRAGRGSRGNRAKVFRHSGFVARGCARSRPRRGFRRRGAAGGRLGLVGGRGSARVRASFPSRERGGRVRVGRRRDGRAVGPLPGPRARVDPGGGGAGWRTTQKSRRVSPGATAWPSRGRGSQMERRRVGGVRGAAPSRHRRCAEKEKGDARRLGSLRVRVRACGTTQAGAEHPDVLLTRGVTLAWTIAMRSEEPRDVRRGARQTREARDRRTDVPRGSPPRGVLLANAQRRVGSDPRCTCATFTDGS